MKAAVIFDVDGTLVDSVDLHAEAWQRAMQRFGRDVPIEVVRHQIGKGADQLLPDFFSAEELEEIGEKLREHRGELFKAEYLPRVTAFPGVRELFQAVRARGARLALASSAKGDELEAYLKIANIADLVETKTSASDVSRSKPEPDVFAAALEKLGVAASDAVAVGDTPYDAIAAGKLGLPIVGVLSGGFPAGELHAAGCQRLYRDPAELLTQLDDLLT